MITSGGMPEATEMSRLHFNPTYGAPKSTVNQPWPGQ